MSQISVHLRKGIFASILLWFFCQFSTSEAALLYFDPAAIDVYRGDTVTIGLRLDTDEGECINTVDATIQYDPSIRAVDVSRGNSILNLWVEDPVIDESNHTIHFAGGIPGGYCGRIPGDPSLTNVLLELVFRSPGFSINTADNKNARIWLADSSQVLLHDGFGTVAPLTLQESQITLLETAGSAITDSWNTTTRNDEEPPSDFSITLARDEVAFNSKYFITFNSIDKQSGIDHYEVMEEPFREFYTFAWGRVNAPWVVTQSPYVLKDQTLNSTIRVKAIDKAGNERVAVLVPDSALRSMSIDLIITIAIVGGLVALVAVIIIFALYRRKKRQVSDSIEPEYESN